MVFNRAKPRKELRRDLSIIGLVQAVCLTAGVSVVYSERPIAMVFSDGTFTSMTTDDYTAIEQPVPDFSEFPGRSPRWISVILPDDPEEQSIIRRTAMEQSIPIRTLADYYRPFEPTHVDLDRDGLDLERLEQRDDQTPFLQAFLDEHGGSVSDYVFVPFGTRYTLALMAVRKADLAFLFLPVPGGILTSG